MKNKNHIKYQFFYSLSLFGIIIHFTTKKCSWKKQTFFLISSHFFRIEFYRFFVIRDAKFNLTKNIGESMSSFSRGNCMNCDWSMQMIPPWDQLCFILFWLYHFLGHQRIIDWFCIIYVNSLEVVKKSNRALLRRCKCATSTMLFLKTSINASFVIFITDHVCE